MTTKYLKATGAVLGAVALAGSGVAVAAPAIMGADAMPQAMAQEQVQAASLQDAGNVAKVEGAFSYNQDAVTSSADIAKVFCKAAAAVCASMPEYGVAQVADAIEVGGDVANGFAATVGEMALDEDVASFLMACSCASNIAGGGAVANADVSGVSLESIAAMAGA